MKFSLLISINMMIFISGKSWAHETQLFESEPTYVTTEYNQAATENMNNDMKVAYLTRLIEHQQKEYDNKVAYLETELRKTKDRLIEKSINQDKLEEAFEEKYGKEVVVLKRELAYKTKTMLEYQRQIEKMKPDEDLKKMIKLNTEMASELRRSEDQIAFMQLKKAEDMKGSHEGSTRLPASVKNSK